MRIDRRALAGVQGAFLVVAGLWPIVHLRSFAAVTGPKPEGWLVKTVGALIAVAGGALVHAARRDEVTPPLALLGAGISATLGGAAGWYAAKGRIAPIYFADTVVESAFVAAWALSERHAGGRGRGLPAVAERSSARFRELAEEAPAGNDGSHDLQ